MMAKRCLRFLLVVLVIFSATCGCNAASSREYENNDRTGNKKEEEAKVTISQECAAVVLVGGSAVGGVAAVALVPSLLGSIGFTSLGVGAGSFAAWWQSTMPMIAAGSLFSTLQSIAMGGMGMGTISIGAALGGATSAAHLEKLCGIVDSLDPESPPGKVVANVVHVVKASSEATDWSRNEFQRGKEWAHRSGKEFLESETFQNAKEQARQAGKDFVEATTKAAKKAKEFVESDEFKELAGQSREKLKSAMDWFREQL